MRILLLLLAIVLFSTLCFEPFISKITSKKWNLLDTLNRDCEVCERKLLEAKISYYSFIFKIKIMSLNLWDNLNVYISTCEETIERDIPEKYVNIKPSSNHYIIQKMVLLKRREAERTQRDLISSCLEFGNKVTLISKRHYKEWDTLIEKWIERYKDYTYKREKSVLSQDQMILRELSIYLNWTLQMYRHRKLVQKHVREIRRLKPPEMMLEYPEELKVFYDYYENIHGTLFNNTLYLMKKNIDEVSNEIISAFTESSFNLVKEQHITLMQAKSLYQNRAIKNKLIIITTNEKFRNLKYSLQDIWYHIPKKSLKTYFTPKLTGWQRVWHIMVEIYNWFMDFIREKLTKEREGMYKHLYNMYH